MTEADLYPHLAHLAGGQVYPYVVPLLAPGSVSEMQDYIPENRCYRATLEFQVTV